MRPWSQILPSSELNSFFAETEGEDVSKPFSSCAAEAGQKEKVKGRKVKSQKEIVMLPLLLDQRTPSSSDQL